MDVMSNQKGKKRGKNRNTGRNQVEDMATKVGHHGRKCIQLTILITPALRVCVCMSCLCFVACPLQGFYGHVSVLSEQPDSTQLN